MKLFLVTASGRQIDPGAPKVSDIYLPDIVSGLAKEERYDSVTIAPINVAHHSCLVYLRTKQLLREPRWAALTNTEARAVERAALMHDAPEAYLGDIVAPLKALLPDYKAIEERWAHMIGERFGITEEFRQAPIVKEADRHIFQLEAVCKTIHPSLYGMTPAECEQASWFMGTSHGGAFHTLLGEHPKDYREWSKVFFQNCCNSLGIY